MNFDTLLQQCSPDLRAQLSSSNDAVLVADDAGRYLCANERACQLLGVSLHKLLGTRIEDYLPPGFDFKGAWRRFVDEGSQSGDITLRRPDGMDRAVHFRALRDIWPGHHVSILWEGHERSGTRTGPASRAEKREER